ncbi:MAG: hypothetical protein JWO35_319 [Candidatus Saccharibacteria bacterium]|nr:hypothetical protein [Candidatus Saccharibacteria bacterium]
MKNIESSDRNYAQAILSQSGRKEAEAKGIDPNAIDGVTLRRNGARRFGRRAVATVASVGVVMGGGELLGYAIDNSPTTKYQRSIQEQSHDVPNAAAQQLPAPAEQPLVNPQSHLAE